MISSSLFVGILLPYSYEFVRHHDNRFYEFNRLIHPPSRIREIPFLEEKISVQVFEALFRYEGPRASGKLIVSYFPSAGDRRIFNATPLRFLSVGADSAVKAELRKPDRQNQFFRSCSDKEFSPDMTSASSSIKAFGNTAMISSVTTL